MVAKDSIFINNLKITTTVGVNTWEQKIAQELLLDLEIITSLKSASNSDSLSDTIDYSNLSHAISNLCLTEKNYLIESLAEKIAKFILDNYLIKAVNVTLKKPSALANANTVGVKIARSK